MSIGRIVAPRNVSSERAVAEGGVGTTCLVAFEREVTKACVSVAARVT